MPPPRAGRDFNSLALLAALMLAVLGVFVLSPLLFVFINSFETNALGQAVTLGTGNWTRIFTQGQLLDTLWNTLSLSVARQTIGMGVGVLLAWLIARTDLPGKTILETGFWIALFMPALPVTLSWVMLAGGRSGMLNQWAMQTGLFDGAIFNIYSWWGIVWVHLMTSSIAIKVFLLAPAFRALDSTFEEAARTSGASLPAILVKIVVPLLTPVLLVVLLVSLVRSMQAFEVELILGTPKQISVYSTVIYTAMTREPPAQGLASALSCIFVLSIIPFVLLQQWYSARHAHATVSGKFQNRLTRLGAWRWPVFAFVVALLCLMTIVPFVLLVMATFMNMFGAFGGATPWTLDNWERALFDGEIGNAFANTLRLSISAALAGMIGYTVIAWVSLQQGLRVRRLIDFLTWLPVLIPGLVLSLGLLQMFTAIPMFRIFYGTTAALVVAILIGVMTIGVQIVRGALIQVGRELDEAAIMSGASRFCSFRRILLPLIAPSVVVAGLEVFATANAAVGVIVLLGTGPIQPLSIMQLTLLDSGRFEQASVIGVIIMGLTVTSAILARYIGQRAGVGRDAARA